MIRWPTSMNNSYSRDVSIDDLFEHQASATPDRIALAWTNGNLSYGHLNLKANRLASRLSKLGAGRGSMVGLCMVRSPELIVGMLAILKAGAAYVPLDPDYPDDRIVCMLGDTSLNLILSHRPTAHRVASIPLTSEVRIINYDSELMEEHEAESVAIPRRQSTTADDLAYVMYTSGSTGKPKGVMVGHRAVVRLVRGTDYCDFGEDEVFLLLAPTSFDASTFEIWGPLLNGARLAIMPPGPTALDVLADTIRRQNVTTLWLTAGLFSLVVEHRPEILPHLRQLLAGGDVLSPPHVEKALASMPNGTLINGYGPTEGTTFSCCHRMEPGYRVGDKVPIGRPIAHTTAFILDESLEMVKDGQTGELFIGGDGLAIGYLNDPALTKEKFVSVQLGSTPSVRLYRTGDLARFGPDGEIEFLGRRDRQVKVSGYRVELTEIETAIQRHPDVGSAAVNAVIGPNGEKRLVAHIVRKVGHDGGQLDLRTFLSPTLPGYMIPAQIVEVDQLPLSPNGKVDRSALPQHVRDSSQHLRPEPEGSSLIGEISRLWSEALGREVGLDDNFFDLGGDSLMLIGLHSKLQRLRSQELSVTDLFEYTTIRTLAECMSNKLPQELPALPGLDRAKKQREAMAEFQPRKGSRE